MAGIKALGKGSIAAALYVLMTVITVLGWIGFIGCVVLLAAFIAIDLTGGEFLVSGLEIYKSVPLETYLVAFAILFVIFIGFILMAGQLKKILKTLMDGDPFVPENARRLTRLALIVAGMELANLAIGFAAQIFNVKTTADFSVNLAAWVAVITLMVLSQVFAEGTRLREEEKMTI
ncbi:MAG: hypothetical protein CMK07_09115 [Ponticaulis sp.]|nr:hypothetical protein [Ponticaulis sp.]